MNILSSPLWPSDMPDDRRVIALLGLVQISEDKMSLVQAVEQMEEEIERLNALVAMQSETLEKIACIGNGDRHGNSIGNCIAIDALSATAETVSAWKSNRDNEIRAKELEEAAGKFDGSIGYNWTAADGYTNAFEIASELNFMASELRAKGEWT